MVPKAMIAAGAGLVGAAAHFQIVAHGGYGSPEAPISIALVIAMIVGAIGVAALWGKHRAGAILLALSLALGDGYAVALTAVAQLHIFEAERAPVVNARRTYDDALKRRDASQKALDAAEDARRKDAPAPGCKAECARMHAASVAAARTERDAAREALSRVKIPTTTGAAALAAWIGTSESGYAVGMASLRAVAVNLVGALLLSLGAHALLARRNEGKCKPDITPPPQALTPKPEAPATRPALASTSRDAETEMMRFAVDCLRPADGSSVAVVDLRTRYLAWARACGIEALPDRALAAELSRMIDRTGLPVENYRVVGMQIAA